MDTCSAVAAPGGRHSDCLPAAIVDSPLPPAVTERPAPTVRHLPCTTPSAVTAVAAPYRRSLRLLRRTGGHCGWGRTGGTRRGRRRPARCGCSAAGVGSHTPLPVATRRWHGRPCGWTGCCSLNAVADHPRRDGGGGCGRSRGCACVGRGGAPVSDGGGRPRHRRGPSCTPVVGVAVSPPLAVSVAPALVDPVGDGCPAARPTPPPPAVAPPPSGPTAATPPSVGVTAPAALPLPPPSPPPPTPPVDVDALRASLATRRAIRRGGVAASAALVAAAYTASPLPLPSLEALATATSAAAATAAAFVAAGGRGEVGLDGRVYLYPPRAGGGPAPGRGWGDPSPPRPAPAGSLTVRPTGDGRGWGVYAAVALPAGTALGAYAGERLDNAAFFARYPPGCARRGDYVVALDAETVVDGAAAAAAGRAAGVYTAALMNHARGGAVARVMRRRRRAVEFVTVRPVVAGEELCWDYGRRYWAGREAEEVP
ncbi:hypothetical protein BU14_0200s0004 [Porphyra umbilicalis]|uniref:SET domain-containing protein n=1 Tax=Porphyra umbilicalis TaxID=2786 RepID=A0A1X6P5R7_PORUM|nr:hypothetical protein BU14_0200s0004 [Porphyra umbilicalis]|eukprot:OSX76249.1 hypothetical protein BU14_0200s0004 [Porphyra umbilicalis]